MQVEKNVFVVFYSGEKVKNKILKICDAFGANRYSFPEDLGKQAQTITEVFIIILDELADYHLYDFFLFVHSHDINTTICPLSFLGPLFCALISILFSQNC